MRMPRNKNLKTDRALFTADTLKIAEHDVLVTMCCYVNAVRASLIHLRHRELWRSHNGEGDCEVQFHAQVIRYN